jgi:hypothetical protein
VPVVPDGCGEGEESGGDAGVDPGEGSAAVLFEGELAFQGVEHGLDPLPHGAELAVAGVLVRKSRRPSEARERSWSQFSVELSESLVGQDRFAELLEVASGEAEQVGQR